MKIGDPFSLLPLFIFVTLLSFPARSCPQDKNEVKVWLFFLGFVHMEQGSMDPTLIALGVYISK